MVACGSFAHANQSLPLGTPEARQSMACMRMLDISNTVYHPNPKKASNKITSATDIGITITFILITIAIALLIVLLFLQ